MDLVKVFAGFCRGPVKIPIASGAAGLGTVEIPIVSGVARVGAVTPALPVVAARIARSFVCRLVVELIEQVRFVQLIVVGLDDVIEPLSD